MSFRPVLVQSGLAGWAFLQRTYESQMDAFKRTPEKQSDAAYFRANIGTISSAAELVGDRRLLTVALGAFGLDDDLSNRAFVQRILEDGVSSPDALANRLTDSRYKAFSGAFGFGAGSIAMTKDPSAMASVVDAYWQKSFQSAIGEQDNDARIALYAKDVLPRIASDGSGSDTAQWFSAMGDPPLRQLFEMAFALPSSFSQIDLDRQLEVFKSKMRALTGSAEFRQFTNPESSGTLITRFLAMAQIQNSTATYTPMSTALTLLQAISK